MKTIVYQTGAAPSPAGPYSQAVRRGNVIAVSGQVGFDPATNRLVEGSVAEQTRQALTNVDAVLSCAGASFADVVTVRIHLADGEDFAAMNEAYASHLASPFPCRTTVVSGLPPGLLIEVDVLAVVG
jgi:reactive intermediate/imine deaminase